MGEGRSEVNFLNYREIKKKIPMGKDEKNHSNFHSGTNVCWFKIGGTIFRDPVHGGEGSEFLKQNQKSTYW